MNYDDLMNKFLILNKNFKIYQARQDVTNMYMLLKLLRTLHGNLLLKHYRLCKKIDAKYESGEKDLDKLCQKLSMTDTFLETAKQLIKEHEKALKELAYGRKGIFIPQNVGVNEIIASLENQPYDINKPFFVNFYAPWCAHCKRLMPVWDALRMQNYNIVKVDCVKYPQLCDKYGVQGFPTIKLFRDGSVIDYQGPRTIEKFIEFLNN